MGFTVKDFPDLIRLLREHEEWREQLRALILAEELLRLPAEFRAFRDEGFEKFQKETDSRLAALERAVAALAEAVAALTEAQRRHYEEFLAHRAETDRRFAELAEAVRRLTEGFEAHREEFAAYRAETDRRFAELAEAVRHLTEAFEAHREEFAAHRAETERRFAELAEAQRRTEERVGRLEEIQRRHYEEFLAYRAETERRFAELAEAQRRHYEEFLAYRAETERRFAELAEAQRRHYEEFAAYRAETERRFAELAEAQRRTEGRLDRMEQRILRRLNAFGARWGLRSEAAWREGMRAVLQDVGFQVERWSATDAEGEVFGYPATVELDVVIRNGVRMVIELKASAGRETLPTLERKVRFYEKQTGQPVQRRILVTPWYEPGVEEQAQRMGWELYGEPEEILVE